MKASEPGTRAAAGLRGDCFVEASAPETSKQEKALLQTIWGSVLQAAGVSNGREKCCCKWHAL